HLKWWHRDTGPTDLDNGVLLCTSCHHRVHDNGWDIHITGTGTTARVWLIPPDTIDPTRTPRLGGRARYDIAA
ncbi:HNH endonuclease, partial [Microbacterium sp. NPDC089696]|uniref:HNH endonuclease n=1 Tax=Microbacterium sp. NPDC089696 TaxID=3364199 RepID=UPI003807B82B